MSTAGIVMTNELMKYVREVAESPRARATSS